MNPRIMIILLSLCTLSFAHDSEKKGHRQGDDNECEECQAGYAWWEDECMMVPIDVYGVVMVDEEVYECYGACTRCSAPSTCTHCMHGFNLVDDMCQPCPPGCEDCNQSECEQCLDHYYEHEGGCVACSENCLECDNADECQQCVPGYYPSQDECVLCSHHCSKCNSAQSCSECMNGYMVHPQTGKCIACMMGCDYCTLDTYDSCWEHDIPTYCGENCQECSKDWQCIQCTQEYHLNRHKVCVSNCDFPCLTCGQESYLCRSCFGGYELEEGDCVPKNCTRGEYEDDGCHPCAVDNCSHCVDGSQVCYQCSSGYYLSSVEECSLCPTSCEDCLSEGYCTVCSEGFFMVMGEDGEVTGICQPCSHNCLSCSNNAYNCTQCGQEYFGGEQCWPYEYLMVEMVLDISMEEFVPKVEEIKTVIMGFLGTEYEHRNELLSLYSLYEGSVVATFDLFILPQHQTYEIKEVLQAAIQENMKIGNIKVISFYIDEQIVICNTQVGCSPVQPPHHFPPFIALPFIIVGSLLLIGLAVFCVRRRCKGKESTVNAEPQISEKENNQARTNVNSDSNIVEYEIA